MCLFQRLPFFLVLRASEMLAASQSEDLPHGAGQPGEEVLLGKVQQALATLHSSSRGKPVLVSVWVGVALSACACFCVQVVRVRVRGWLCRRVCYTCCVRCVFFFIKQMLLESRVRREEDDQTYCVPLLRPPRLWTFNGEWIVARDARRRENSGPSLPPFHF